MLYYIIIMNHNVEWTEPNVSGCRWFGVGVCMHHDGWKLLLMLLLLLLLPTKPPPPPLWSLSFQNLLHICFCRVHKLPLVHSLFISHSVSVKGRRAYPTNVYMYPLITKRRTLNMRCWCVPVFTIRQSRNTHTRMKMKWNCLYFMQSEYKSSLIIFKSCSGRNSDRLSMNRLIVTYVETINVLIFVNSILDTHAHIDLIIHNSNKHSNICGYISIQIKTPIHL